ncbi:sec-independent translocase [Nocardioides nematodiphilus]|uniref:sec-independent translocase n=1 Tax=Nocardioides nematodiphilus TaxID=2849669 RepID=UPI001CDA3347|nr:sec-independent translocase [Nocardioides nematodiphilus]MCA1984541.1 Sec-independent protein translocase protein TatB [Nocardioides nematodiphilus]
MFGIGFAELMVVAFVAILVFGPDRLPDVARQAAVLVRRGRALANNVRDELRSELGPEYADLELTDLDPRRFVARQVREAMLEADAAESAREPSPRLGAGELPPYDLDAT